MNFHTFYRDTRDPVEGSTRPWCRPAQHRPVPTEVVNRIIPLIADYHNVWDIWNENLTYDPPLVPLVENNDLDLIAVVDHVTLCAHPNDIPMFGTYADLCLKLRRTEQLKSWARLMLHPDWYRLDFQVRFDIHSVLTDAAWLWDSDREQTLFWQTVSLTWLSRVGDQNYVFSLSGEE